MAIDLIARGLARRANIGVFDTENRVDTLESAQSNTIAEYKNTVTLGSESNQVSIGIAEFNKDNDSLLVFEDGSYIEVYTDYTIPSNSIIQKVSGNWSSGTVFNFIVIKKEIFTGGIDGGGA